MPRISRCFAAGHHYTSPTNSLICVKKRVLRENSGKRGADSQEEVGPIAKAKDNPFEDFEQIPHSFARCHGVEVHSTMLHPRRAVTPRSRKFPKNQTFDAETRRARSSS